ncbi:MAG: hypothetical protein IJV05_08415 [Muribaculaceae bacterium]|nr:hypothetical protein [Muribaculaceae bacterium]
MSKKILSFVDREEKEDWFDLSHPYIDDDIQRIHDPEGGANANPRTAIPSPFAQFDLVQEAFRQLGSPDMLEPEKAMQALRLVHNSLDIAELFFNYNLFENDFEILSWNAAQHLPALETGSREPGQRMLARTLRMYLMQDRESYNFPRIDQGEPFILYFLKSRRNSKIVGLTSPATLFMAVPDDYVQDINVEQNSRLFDWRVPGKKEFHNRDINFVKYILALINAYPVIKERCDDFCSYIRREFELLDPQIKMDLKNQLGDVTSNNKEDEQKALNYLNENFEPLRIGNAPVATFDGQNVAVYNKKLQVSIDSASESDFMIRATKPIMGQVPMVLENCFNPPAGVQFNYVGAVWDPHTVITSAEYMDKAPEARKLPSQQFEYPWLIADDFFEQSLIQLKYELNSDSFFDGNISYKSAMNNCHFLIPIKPLFFKYFSIEDLLRGTVSDGKPMFQLECAGSNEHPVVTAILRIPVSKTDITGRNLYVEYHRSYEQGSFYDADNDQGVLLQAVDAVTIFPFVKLPSMNRYNVQHAVNSLFGSDFKDSKIVFLNDGNDISRLSGDDERVRTTQRLSASNDPNESRFLTTIYHEVEDAFDCMRLELTATASSLKFNGLLIPKWPEANVDNGKQFTFAVDFGTTNTHIECIGDERQPEALNISNNGQKKLTASSFVVSEGDMLSNSYSDVMILEFLPACIGGKSRYNFPQRTVLSKHQFFDEESKSDLIALGDVNIPFSYEKEEIKNCKIIANIKWGNDNKAEKRVEAYLTELALLMRAKVMIDGGAITRTRVVWFYPLSMNKDDRDKMSKIWRTIMHDIFQITSINPDDSQDSDTSNLISMPESVAPYYFHRSSDSFRGSNKPTVSIDIGGGTSDVVVFVPQLGSDDKAPTMMTSFRFAANTIFGDAYLDNAAQRNPMVRKYTRYFHRLYCLDNNVVEGNLDPLLASIEREGNSADINTFMFAIGEQEGHRNNNVYSYNYQLSKDGDCKIVFIYFYTAMIYYVASMLKAKGIALPRHIFFSGTGSKILDIIGNTETLSQVTQAIIEETYGERYTQYEFSVLLNRDTPKQVTCKGALLQMNSDAGLDEIKMLNNSLKQVSGGFGRRSERRSLTVKYTMTSKEKFTFGDLRDAAVCDEIIGQVKQFNQFFLDFCDEFEVVNFFKINMNAWEQFKKNVNVDLDEYLFQLIERNSPHGNQINESAEFEDVPFFYPIAGSIRMNLIPNIMQ